MTPQAVVEAVGDGIKGTAMTHDPGFVMVTDWIVDDLPRLSAMPKFININNKGPISLLARGLRI